VWSYASLKKVLVEKFVPLAGEVTLPEECCQRINNRIGVIWTAFGDGVENACFHPAPAAALERL